MANSYGPRIVTDGLVLHLDAANKKSYPGSGSTWYDLSGNGNNCTIDVSGFTYNSSGYFSMANGGISKAGTMNTTSTCTCVFWMRTSDIQSLFWGSTVSNGYYLGAYASGNKFYNGLCGSPTFFMNTVSKANIYDNIRDHLWHMIEFKSVDFSTWTNYTFNKYNTYTFGDGAIASITIYNRNLTEQESLKNYNALKGRFIPNGTIEKPFNSPAQAQSLGYSDGNYYFVTSSMSSARLLEFKNNYYENKSWVCVFRSPYNSTATTNHLGFNIPMGGLLVQRDTLDIRGAVYWSNPISYNAVGGSGNNTADSGYSPRRVILGFAGGHGIYTTSQNACSWASGLGSIGAGWNGSTCGSFPNGLLWGTGQSSTATYANMSGVWSHWIYWE